MRAGSKRRGYPLLFGHHGYELHWRFAFYSCVLLSSTHFGYSAGNFAINVSFLDICRPQEEPSQDAPVATAINYPSHLRQSRERKTEKKKTENEDVICHFENQGEYFSCFWFRSPWTPLSWQLFKNLDSPFFMTVKKLISKNLNNWSHAGIFYRCSMNSHFKWFNLLVSNFA